MLYLTEKGTISVKEKDSPENNETPPSPIFGNQGMMAGAIAIAVIISLVAIILATGNPLAPSPVPPQDCGRAVISYLNVNLVEAGSTAELVSVTERNGVYEVTIRYKERNIPLHATRDCTLLFTTSFDLKGGTPLTPTPAHEPVKSSRPSAELFVMAFCPYGTLAEGAMDPVAGLLGTKADITVRFIASVEGTTVDSVSSLHGPAEAKEDLRQLCISRYYPAQFWAYLSAFNRDCYPGWQNATFLDACRANTTRSLGMDAQKIETCATGSEGLGLLQTDEAAGVGYDVQSSPTLIINGQLYSGARTPEAYKQAICSRFDTPPAECGTALSSQAATSSGGCG
jgi:hypothetical protein